MKKLTFFFPILLLLWHCNNVGSNVSDATNDSVWLAQARTAIEKNDNNALNKLLSNNKPINNFLPDGSTLLHVAIRKANVEAAKTLLKNGANPDLQANDEYGTTPLMETTNNEQLEIAGLLIEKGANIDKQDKYGDPAIHWSAYWGSLPMTELFLKHNANTMLKSRHSANALIVALKEWKYDVVQLFINYQRGIVTLDSVGKQIVTAVKTNNTDKARQLLLQNPQRVNLTDEAGMSLLSIAAKNNNNDMVKFLVEKGAEIDKFSPAGQTALMWASRFGHTDVAKYLIQHKADVNKHDTLYSVTPLMAAAIGGHADIAALLIDKKADVNICDKISHHSALIWAVMYNHAPVVDILLRNGADTDIRSIHDFTVSDIAQDSVKILLDQYRKK